MSELDDAAFERAYQRMMFRRNQEALRQEMERSRDLPDHPDFQEQWR